MIAWVLGAVAAAAELPHHDLEVLYHEARYDEGLAETDKRLAVAPDKDLYWMKARFLYEIGERWQRTDQNVDKEAWYEGMLAHLV